MSSKMPDAVTIPFETLDVRGEKVGKCEPKWDRMRALAGLPAVARPVVAILACAGVPSSSWTSTASRRETTCPATRRDVVLCGAVAAGLAAPSASAARLPAPVVVTDRTGSPVTEAAWKASQLPVASCVSCGSPHLRRSYLRRLGERARSSRRWCSASTARSTSFNPKPRRVQLTHSKPSVLTWDVSSVGSRPSVASLAPVTAVSTLPTARSHEGPRPERLAWRP